MSSIGIQKIGITAIAVDCIVNAANAQLRAGGGVCGAIFDAAGASQLQEACDRIGGCPTGSAVITPGFKLNAKFIIHAVGPIWNGGSHDEKKLLYSCYTKALEIAIENNIHSIAFPLISAGIYGMPKNIAWRKALQACRDFLEKHPDYALDVIFTVPDGQIMQMGLAEMAAQGIAGTTPQDFLVIAGQRYPAVYFHTPEEPYGFLSNWYLSDFRLDGRTFSSAEQYIMYRKCMMLSDVSAANAVMATDDPAKQQRVARSAVYNETIWNGCRQLVAAQALMAKFTQNAAMKAKLLGTGNAYLVECANSDKVWACGQSLYSSEKQDISLWSGTNILGFALMEVRGIIRAREASDRQGN